MAKKEEGLRSYQWGGADWVGSGLRERTGYGGNDWMGNVKAIEDTAARRLGGRVRVDFFTLGG